MLLLSRTCANVCPNSRHSKLRFHAPTRYLYRSMSLPLEMPDPLVLCCTNHMGRRDGATTRLRDRPLTVSVPANGARAVAPRVQLRRVQLCHIQLPPTGSGRPMDETGAPMPPLLMVLPVPFPPGSAAAAPAALLGLNGQKKSIVVGPLVRAVDGGCGHRWGGGRATARCRFQRRCLAAERVSRARQAPVSSAWPASPPVRDVGPCAAKDSVCVPVSTGPCSLGRLGCSLRRRAGLAVLGR